MGLIPLSLRDQLLYLEELTLGGQRDLLITPRLRLAEQRGPQAVQGVTRVSVIDDRAESAKAQQRGGHRPDDGGQIPAAWHRLTPSQGGRGLAGGHQVGDGLTPDVVTPVGQQRRDRQVARIRGRHPPPGCQRVDHAVAALDGVETRSVFRHIRAPPR